MSADGSIIETVTVEMSDTDMTRYIHFASVVRYFEIGLRSAMAAAGITFRDLFNRGIGIPIVHVECDYRNPMYYGDELQVQTTVKSVSKGTLDLSITITRDDTVTAEGALTAAFISIDDQASTEVPVEVREQFEALVPE